MMKKLLLMLFFIPFFVSAQTIQGSFRIINNTHPENEAFYIASIEKANMESYRLQNQEVILKFENGFDCLMLSAKQLFLNEKSINATSYKTSFSADYLLPSFNILPSGNLVAIYPLSTKKYK